jgi:hypothetical protein
MTKAETENKIDNFLNKFLPFTEECHVVYLMVEIRKKLDYKDAKDYSLLRFYCDWTVHTKKDRNMKSVKSMMGKLYRDIKKEIKTYPTSESEVVKIIYMEQLRKEMNNFLREFSLSNKLIKNDDSWLSFVKLLIRVLENQPINNPTNDVKTFYFIPSSERCIAGKVIFKNKIQGKDGNFYDHYRFSNIY